ncbi:hypothetical protein GGS26DRAFT_593840 [Hypomontagnella submonticulosa]|nr:hypothetical protein GGS26DRAFT_593840 [Hypomontagnella submonticulosa]
MGDKAPSEPSTSRNQLSIPSSPLTPGSPNSEASAYSCTKLDDTSEYRYLNAANVRKQVTEAPQKKLKGSRYPFRFRNKEEIPNLKSQEPRKEWPLTAGKHAYTAGNEPGPARALINSKQSTRDTFDVIYHTTEDPAMWSEDFETAPYRPAGYKRSSGSKKSS